MELLNLSMFSHFSFLLPFSFACDLARLFVKLVGLKLSSNTLFFSPWNRLEIQLGYEVGSFQDHLEDCEDVHQEPIFDIFFYPFMDT